MAGQTNPQVQDDMVKKLTNLEGTIMKLQESLATIQTDNLNLKKQLLKTNKEKEELREQVQALSGSVKEKIETQKFEFQKIKSKTEGMQRQLETFQTTNGIGDLRTEVGSISQRLKQLEDRHGDTMNSQVRVAFKCDEIPLVIGQCVSLNKTKEVRMNVGGWFNRDTGKIRTAAAGHYLVNVWISQIGNGRIRLDIRDNVATNWTLGRTTYDNDVQRFSLVLYFPAKSTVWLNAALLQGEAKLEECWMFVRLL